ncbi:DNA-nicking Smr family endonuclease [Sulfuritortus calidifontis]|uniref:DNA-nicking Smr family endonuclease n=1 Tax=Sulfuritortus calidifontis TaxID=1914471 RepID=A0A4R3JU22_9PROT|nr:DNA-nicking Smr family endonuclease [Sulfuritortus calidifontis]
MKKGGKPGKPWLSAPASEDIELFRSEVANAIPLGPHGRFLHPFDPPPALPLSRLRDQREVMLESLTDPSEWDESTENGEELVYVRSGISRQVLRRLRNGAWRAQAELDLHGLTRAEAKIELVEFLHECFRRGARCVRIIHGKGLGSPNREPVLKQAVRHWLAQREEVLAYVQARPADGGGGAVVVLLKSRP